MAQHSVRSPCRKPCRRPRAFRDLVSQNNTVPEIPRWVRASAHDSRCGSQVQQRSESVTREGTGHDRADAVRAGVCDAMAPRLRGMLVLRHLVQALLFPSRLRRLAPSVDPAHLPPQRLGADIAARVLRPERHGLPTPGTGEPQRARNRSELQAAT
jgi:hypothetical protein